MLHAKREKNRERGREREGEREREREGEREREKKRKRKREKKKERMRQIRGTMDAVKPSIFCLMQIRNYFQQKSLFGFMSRCKVICSPDKTINSTN
jgi:hypothetical protein